jgi:L-threonylcarbamoyladenylate synthase
MADEKHAEPPPNVVTADAATIAAAARLLVAGDLVAFPTETVYGLGGDATSDRAVARIFEAKGRPHFNPLIVHFPDADSACAQVAFDERAHRLAERFWPGALTLVLPRRRDCAVSLLASAGLDSLAVRVPGTRSLMLCCRLRSPDRRAKRQRIAQDQPRSRPNT